MEKNIILSPYQQWQVDKYGNIISSTGSQINEEQFENTNQDLERVFNNIESQAQIEIMELG